MIDAVTLGALPGALRDETATTTQFDRVDAPSARFSLLDEMIVERGSIDDWNLLHDLHYKAEKLPMGPRFWRLRLAGQTIGVLVMGAPKGLLKERHLAFPHLKPGKDTKITNTYRYKWINSNIRVISRFVTDTMFRGIGAGYRMMNLVSRMEGYPIIEIQSSMSKFNLFGQKAGFTFVKPLNSNKYDQGLRFFRSTFAANPADFELIVREIEEAHPGLRDRMVTDAREFYYRHSALEKTGNNRDNGAKRVDAMGHKELVKALQQLVLASPMYGVWKNPDAGRELPDRLPLTAFEWQGPNEPLKLENLK